MGSSVRILRRDDVRAALDMAGCIDAVEAAFAAYAAGAAELPAVIHLDVPDGGGEVHVKAGYVHRTPAFAVKVASGFSAPDPPAIDGLVMVFDAADGAPTAILLDGGYLTDLRTGAAGGVAARHLAPATARTVALLGTGAQARMQLEALRVVRPGIEEVRVWGRRPDRARATAADLSDGTEAVRAVDAVEEAVWDADVIVTCTAAREPLVQSAWVREGALVTAVGSDGPGKQELDPALLRRADILVVDSLEQCVRLGELQHAPDESVRAVELGAICGGTAPGRTAEEQLTVCDLTGVGVQDVAAASAVLANAPPDAGESVER